MKQPPSGSGQVVRRRGPSLAESSRYREALLRLQGSEAKPEVSTRSNAYLFWLNSRTHGDVSGEPGA
jgi:hypothetical protein